MATRRYKINPNENEGSIVEEVGAATNSKAIELTVDIASTIVNKQDGSGTAGTRAVTKEEVLRAIGNLHDYILKNQWPPA